MTTYNTIQKLSTKTLDRFEGLNIYNLEMSKGTLIAIVEQERKSNSNDSYNTFDRYTRPIDNYNGLLISVFELSKRNRNVNFKKVKLVKPKKTYTNKIKIIKKYTNKVKY